MTSEASFTKSFLSALDILPVKLRSDHVFDPQQVGLRVPYMLPRLQPPHPEMPKKVKRTVAPGASKSVTIRLKSARSPVLEFTLPNMPLATTSVPDLRDAVQARVVNMQDERVPLDKIKILYKRKPVTGKTVAEVLADEPDVLAGGKEVEFGVMIMGGAKVVEVEEEPAPAPAPAPPAADEKQAMETDEIPKPAVGPSGDEVVETEAFWTDLQGFMEQRLKDEAVARRLRTLFETTWKANR
ncbi:hypothetical protein ASPZODRAFT_26653 [Penicilliopsis zonata CBS 506.65]|uniref:Ubiquitin-like domain-containing protein n=1 Tax=Penicilliopsis zonata CBS 506.65 TaxID=1073090 RepID=A0A1L9SDJ7_9EURO|nr:hypothetical protein ASPZODRAFT_26653 [Penicilliopsis zonata CBS 506.65]OJJ45290.1 hypothetical protein ASPZODRAFT_26653 [Penicilliopsis zonata CBS 506.65]